MKQGSGTFRYLAWCVGPRPAAALVALVLGSGMLCAQSGDYSLADIEQGGRLFQADCAVCHGPDGDAVQGIDLARGKFKRVTSDEDLTRIVTVGIPGTAMPPFDLQRRQVAALVAYLRSLRESASHPAVAGDADRGQVLFEKKQNCLQCHRVDGQGSRLGPDLSEVGRLRSAAALQQSILEPETNVRAEYLFCRAVTRDGVTITGRRLNEDPSTVQLIDSRERLISLIKADLREYTLMKTSAMPSYKGKLSPEEVADIVKYLATRKGLPAR